MTTQRPTLPEKKWAELPDLESLRHAPIQEGRFSVAIDEGKFEACYWPKPGSGRLYVLLSGARDLKSRAWPNFDRWSWAPVFPGSVLCVADPTLALDTDRLRIGWYVGTRERDWLQGLADLVGAVADKAGVATRQVVCYGSSAGGFGALALACRLGDATAVAINPQTDVLKYHVRPVRQFLRIAFPGQDGAKLSPRSAAGCRRWKRCWPPPARAACSCRTAATCTIIASISCRWRGARAWTRAATRTGRAGCGP